MEQYAIWQRTLKAPKDKLEPQRARLREAFLAFRDNVKHLVGEIAGLLPDLTIHDITHLDALWRVADQIAGPKYPINPAEAFVLGGAFLLHDAAHVLAAYPDRLDGIKQCVQWSNSFPLRSLQQAARMNDLPCSRFCASSMPNARTNCPMSIGKCRVAQKKCIC